MAMSAVKSATSGSQQLMQQVTARKAEPQVQQPPRQENKPAQAARQTQQVQAQQPAQRPERSEEAKRVEQSRPVVNAQGQKTGTIINTSA